jgi:hypothetical protein
MADTPIDDRKFTDREVGEILKRAARHASSSSPVRREGLSLAELKAIGAEVGIDPDRLADAAHAVVLESGNRPNRFLGGPTVLTFERKVRGEIDPADTPEILSSIRRNMGQQGEASEIHGSLEWSANGESGSRYVTLSSRDGTTTITSSANLSNLAILTFVPAGAVGLIFSGVGLTTFIKDGSTAGLVVFLVLLPVLYMILRTIVSRFTTAESRKLQRVADELAILAGDSEP